MKSFTFDPVMKTTPKNKVVARPTTPSHSVKRWPGGNLIAVLLIAAACWGAYQHTRDYSFHFDDTHAIVHNQDIRDFSGFSDLSYWLNPNNRPLAYFTFALNYNEDLNPTPYHNTNILIHLFAAIVLFLLVKTLFRTPALQSSPYSKHSLYIALFTALIFALHPLQTQAVTYIVQRMTSLSALFCLTALWLYLVARTLPKNTIRRNAKSVGLFFLAIAAWFAALLSKQEAASLPLLIVAAEFFFFIPLRISRRNMVLALLTGLMVAAGILVAVLGLIPAEKGAPEPLLYFATQMKVVLKYIQLAILPVQQMADYGWKPASSPFEFPVILSSLIHVFLIAIAFALRKKNPLVSFGISLFYLPLAVTSTVFPIRDVIFEHRMYLSVAGFALIMAFFFAWMYQKHNRKLAIVLAVGYLCLLGYGTVNRNRVWKDSCTLWEDALQKAPGNTRAWLAVGDCLKQRGDRIGALEHYNRSLEIDSLNPTTLNNRGNLKLVNGDFDGAINDYNTILRTSPESRHLALLNRGIAYSRKQDYLRAANDFTAAIETGLAEPQTWFHRGIAYVYLGDYSAAISDLKEAVQKDPSNQDALFNLASAYMNTDQFNDAVIWYSKLLRINPDHLNALQYRGSAFLNTGRRDDACADWQRGATLQHEACMKLAQRYCTKP